jgi:hypothetical protein
LEAIEVGGNLQTLASAVARREAEREALERKIREARGAVQPELRPQPGLKDYVVGDASIFTGEFAKDRATVDRMIEAISISNDGIIVLEFRASLFGQITYEVHGLGDEGQPGDLAEQRDAMHFAQAGLAGVPKVVRDFGHGRVEVVPDPAVLQNTSGVPRGTWPELNARWMDVLAA